VSDLIVRKGERKLWKLSFYGGKVPPGVDSKKNPPQSDGGGGNDNRGRSLP